MLSHLSRWKLWIFVIFIKLIKKNFLAAAAPAEAPVQENGEANGEVKEPVDPNAPKKCDVIVISGRKERCEAAIESLKVDQQRNSVLVLGSCFFSPCEGDL